MTDLAGKPEKVRVRPEKTGGVTQEWNHLAGVARKYDWA